MKKSLICSALVIAGFTMAACGNTTTNTNTDNAGETYADVTNTTGVPASTQVVPIDTTHNSRSSLDYQGTYRGVLPCADCEGIRTEITLRGDNYTLKRTYLGKSGNNTYESSGTYSWNATGNMITLSKEEKPNQYRVGENTLYHLDMNGNMITGDLSDKYILRK